MESGGVQLQLPERRRWQAEGIRRGRTSGSGRTSVLPARHMGAFKMVLGFEKMLLTNSNYLRDISV